MKSPTHGIFFKNQFEGLSKYVDISIINIKTDWIGSPKRLFFGKQDIISDIHEQDIHIYQDKCTAIPKLQPFSSPSYKRKGIEAFNRLVEVQGMPDLIHAHITYPGGYIGLELSEKFNIPLIVTEHASYFSGQLTKGLYKKFSNKVLKGANKYTAVSEVLAEKIVISGRKECLVIPNFINVSDFPLKPITTENKNFSFINIAALRHIKGIDILLKATKILVSEIGRKNFKIHLVGGGKDERKYRKMAEQLGIINWCHFHGNVEHNKIPSLIHNSDALVIASRAETFCIAGIEAMACGIPVLSTNCGGTNEYITNETGYKIEGFSPEELAAGMSKMMDQKERWESEKIREFVKNNYSVEVVSEQIVKLYNRVLQINESAKG
ncbi:glycosyltransferase [Peribacillus simplex]|uniref:glycosyltransferase n=1 Tax=Peribacillus simplex TaxID=1478 RepID=UPI003D29BC5A